MDQWLSTKSDFAPHPPEDITQRLETFLVVTVEQSMLWHVVGRG